MRNHLFFRNTFRSGSTDIICIQNLQHIGSGITHKGTNTYDSQRNNRKDHMLCHIQYLTYTSIGLMHTAYDTIQVNPFQINRENPFQNGSKEKGRQRNTDQCKNGNCIINPAVLLRCRYNTQRYGNDNFQQEGGQCQSKRIPDDTGKFLFYWLMENPGFSEFTMNSFSKPDEITFQDRLIQSISGI